jgi:hypothetical protein
MEIIEQLKDNFTFCLVVGWILFVILFVIIAIVFTNEPAEWIKYRKVAWIFIFVFGLLMFILQNIYIYLY